MRPLLFLLCILVTAAAQPRTPDPDAGVSETLARDRAARISDIHYQLSLQVPESKQQPLSGRIAIALQLHNAQAGPLVVDFDPNRSGVLRRSEVNGREITVRQVNGHILVPQDAVHDGTNSLAFEFNAGDAPLNRSEDYLYTIFVPARAHEAFPCFDQPDLKARWNLSLDVPEAWQSVSNGKEDRRDTINGRARLQFAETQSISTYLFAFATGKWNVETAERNGRTFRMFHRETDAAKVARNRDAIFDLHAAALKWLEEYTGIPYPFGKFDFVLVPAFQFGGMEHPGAIFYNASGLMLDESATQNQKLERASVISHETTHVWFGDLVTMKWFNDVWMKEVFANYMAAKIVNPSFPNINHELRFLLAYYPSAYEVDRTEGTNEIRQPLHNLNEAGTLYGAIIYQKAPIVMRQLEALLGPEPFRDGLREYLKKYSFGNATWTDLIALLASRTKEDLPAWSHTWVEERGRPVIMTELKVTGGKIDTLALSQRDPIPSRGLVWNQRMQVAVGYADGIKLLPVHFDGARVVVPGAEGLPAPLFVLPNGAGIGYGEFHLDPASLSWLMKHTGEIDDALTRGASWVTLWDAMLDGEAHPDALIDLGLGSLPRESDELNVQRVLSYVSNAYWRYLPEARRTALTPEMERTLRAGLERAQSQSLKSAWFNALRDTALTPTTVTWLTNVWRQQEQIPGLVLSEPDYIRLSEELAVRGVPDSAAILEQQYERTKNPDRKALFAFVRPVLSADVKERDAWFASLGDVANRRHEAWVLDGLRYLHHPLRAAASEKYILPSLQMLLEIQRTGDIFFPKRWMDMTLGGHSSPAAAATVRAFLAKLPPGYPERLRRIILSSADELFRASRVH